MERFLFAKLEMWVVILLGVLSCIAMIGFGYLVLDAERDAGRFGLMSELAHNIAEVPDTAKN